METATLIPFVIVAFITTISPGPATLLAVSNSVKFGPGKALWSSLGNSSGLLLVSGTVTMGLGSILQASALIFAVLKFSGAVYLIYLGINQWKSGGVSLKKTECNLNLNEKRLKLFTQGLLVAITNPKAIIFFITLFPQFMTKNAGLTEQFITLSVIFSTCALISHTIYFALSVPISKSLLNIKRVKLFSRISGAIFTCFGLSLFWIRRTN